MESGLPKEHFIEILPLKKANAESIYCALVKYCREKNFQLGRLIGVGFDGAGTFSGDKTGVQRRLKELSPHALFVHCRCHVLQLASVQEANATPGIKHIYATLMTLWKFFHYSPKQAESLKEIQKVLDLPELKIGHECCIKAVKASYSSIILDYILPQVAKLNCALQTKLRDLSLISSLVDATLNSLDDATLDSAN